MVTKIRNVREGQVLRLNAERIKVTKKWRPVEEGICVDGLAIDEPSEERQFRQRWFESNNILVNVEM